MNSSIILNSTDQDETIVIATKLARALSYPCFITLSGPLGAGKTTFCRGILHNLGYQDKVKSPTFTLVEPYYLENITVYHFDLYRLSNSEELELIGIRDYFSENALILMEWPERASEILPQADINCNILIQNTTRKIELSAFTVKGEAILQRINE